MKNCKEYRNHDNITNTLYLKKYLSIIFNSKKIISLFKFHLLLFLASTGKEFLYFLHLCMLDPAIKKNYWKNSRIHLFFLLYLYI